ncbi:asparaginase [Caulobacter sp. KR2-114]|uniref:asparaginase n=1 Tax=Caulobacter sp. KR2-114 TaxID=3400912 RepID=UPI003BFE71CD
MTSKVQVFALGGTIAMAPRREGGVAPGLNGDDLVGAVAAWTGGIDVAAETLFSLPSASLTFAQVAQVAARARAAADAGASGIVVTQGTDTIEETAFLLDLLLDLDAPVVVTGAMRAPSQAGPDGPANLLAAIQTAASDEARGAGVLVVFNDEIHTARFVAKRHTHKPSAFVSPLAGPIGWIAEGRVHVPLRPARPAPTFAWPAAGLPEVVLLAGPPDDGGRLVRALLADPPAGVVLQAMGAGHTPRHLAPLLGDLADRIPVVLASRAGAGQTLRQTYGFDGSEIDLTRRGLIPAGMLDAPKARILLALLLADGADRARIVAAFDD